MPTRRLGEYDERIAKMIADAAVASANMNAHIEADRVAFKALIDQLTEVNQDVKKILQSKAFAAGIWKAITIFMAGGAGVALVGLIWRLVVGK